jgi:hypothetical protein
MLNELTLNEKAFSILSGEHEQYERENGNENENIIGLLKISTALQTDFHFFSPARFLALVGRPQDEL